MTALQAVRLWIEKHFPAFAGVRAGERHKRSPWHEARLAAEVQVLEERAMLSATYSVDDAMGWDGTAPTYPPNVAYTSSGVWEGLKVVNYSPSHYADFNSSGQLTFSDGTVLGDTTFQNNLATGSPFLNTNGTTAGQYVNYIQGNPQLLIYNDLAQLAAAGFDGVRLYADSPDVEIFTILAANELSTALGKQFYVELEVDVPDLSQDQYYGNGSAAAIDLLYSQEVAALPMGSVVEGGLQQLYYVINIVGAQAFSQAVPMVYFGHEELVQPTSDKGQPLSDTNSSVPMLQWGINATRDILSTELSGYALPAVTTAIVAGQVVDVSTANNPEIAKLIATIQADTNAPIAYDVYAFQWGNIYFDTTAYPYDNGAGVIANAYPPDAEYYDRTTGWTTGPKPVGVNQNFTAEQAVTDGDLMWSLQWMIDRVNWIWGANTGGVAKQVVAETGWASTQLYTDGNGKQIEAVPADAALYFNTVNSNGFVIDGVPIMYFEAFDEPVKEVNSAMYSENHYGIFGWTGKPKFSADPGGQPLADPFSVVTIAPTNTQTNSVAQADANKGATDIAYTLQVTNGGSVVPGSTVNVPFFWGTGGFSSGAALGPTTTWMPNPSVFLRDGDIVTVTSADPGTQLSSTIQLTFDDTAPFATSVGYVGGTVPNAGQTLTAPTNNFGAPGSSFELFLSWPWLHGGSNNYGDTATYQPVYQDFWGSSSQMHNGNLMVAGTPGQDIIKITAANSNGNSPFWQPFGWKPPTTNVQVEINGVKLGTFDTSGGKINIKGFDGDDKITVGQSIRTSAVIDGGHGNDLLKGGRGNDLLKGGLGRDILIGGAGRNKMIQGPKTPTVNIQAGQNGGKWWR